MIDPKGDELDDFIFTWFNRRHTAEMTQCLNEFMEYYDELNKKEHNDIKT